jgi:ribonuclease P protein subunit RPR2
LGNRRAFDEHLARAVRRAATGGEPVGLALIDLDSFKEINDTQGHAAGDRILQGLARGLLRCVRANEEVFRTGGDEFALVVAGDSRSAALVASRLQAELRRRRRGIQLPTLSFGIASAPGDAEGKAKLLERADAALYEAKRAGGNRVRVWGGASVSAAPAPGSASPARVLVVDDDAALRMLLRTTFERAGIEIEEAGDASQASSLIADWLPDVVVLDVGLPGMDGLAFCKALKERPATDGVSVVLLTGDDAVSESAARAAGADALLRKPFSPLEVLTVVERLAAGYHAGPFRRADAASTADQLRPDQLLLYAEDLRRVLDAERAQRGQLQRAYRATVRTLASALESKDLGTRAHSERVQRYALTLALAVEPGLAEDPSVEYGFLLHDVGKIGIPDRILLKRGPLSPSERRVMKTHTLLGEGLLGDVPLLDGEGLRIVRSHHERWDGDGYPDGLAGTQIPLAARIFSVADALDAMTSDRPYRAARSWDEAAAEIQRETERQFDPTVVEAFVDREQALRRTYAALAAA